MKIPEKANAQGQRIYHITPANQTTTLSNIHHDLLVMQEIRNALNAGLQVITHTDAVSMPGWSGAGYIIYDADTGGGAFKIAGGGNGGNYTAESVGLLAISFLSIFATGGVFTLSIVGALAAYLTLLAAFVGTMLLVYEIISDPNQFWEEKGQITFIIAAMLGPILAPLQGAGLATGSQELWTLIGWVISVVLGLIGTV